jgi:tetratricopeptide (TPR) repeat protein
MSQPRDAMLKPHSPAVYASALAEAVRLHLAGEFKRARVIYEDLVRRHPDEPRPRMMLTELDIRDGRLATARRQLEDLVRKHPGLREIRTSLAGVAEELGDITTAIETYRKDVEAAPNDGAAALRLAAALRIAGRLEESGREFRAAAVKWPTASGGYVGLTAVDPAMIEEADIERMKEFASAWNPNEQERIQVLFALGEVYDKRREYSSAFHAYADGNTLHVKNLGQPTRDLNTQFMPVKAPTTRTSVEAVEAQQRDFINGMRDLYTAPYVARFAGIGHKSDAPIFIVGMPRSGSTLLEQIIASHPRVHSLGETVAYGNAFRQEMPATRAHMTQEFQRSYFARVGETYLNALKELGWTGESRVIDKMLGNFVNVGAIHLTFPNATIVNSMRDPVDTCFSCFRHLFKDRNETTYDLGAMGRYYVHYRGIMDYWDQLLPGRVVHIQHEHLLAEPETRIRELIAACRLEWDDACLRFHENTRAVRTSSASQVRRPLFKSSVARWKPYERHLTPLFEALGPYAPAGWRERADA